MTYGVKVIHTHTIGENDHRIYEELVLKVEADSFDDAYEKAEAYMQDYVCEYTNIYGETVKTLSIEAVNCYLADEPEGDVQEVFSSFSINHSSLSEEEYYCCIADSCTIEERYPILNTDFN